MHDSANFTRSGEIRRYLQDVALGKTDCMRISSGKPVIPNHTLLTKDSEDLADMIRVKINRILTWHVFDEREKAELNSIPAAMYAAVFEKVNLAQLVPLDDDGFFCTAPIEVKGLLKDYCEHIGDFVKTYAAGEVVFRNNVRKDAYINANARQFTIVLVNLIVNALKHSHSVSNRVDVILNRICDNQKITVTVLDYGVGIDPPKLKRIISDRVKLLTSGEDYKTSKRIGLIVASQLAEKMNAKLIASNYPGAGAEFTLIFDAEAKPQSSMILRDSMTGDGFDDNMKLIDMALSQIIL